MNKQQLQFSGHGNVSAFQMSIIQEIITPTCVFTFRCKLNYFRLNLQKCSHLLSEQWTPFIWMSVIQILHVLHVDDTQLYQLSRECSSFNHYSWYRKPNLMKCKKAIIYDDLSFGRFTIRPSDLRFGPHNSALRLAIVTFNICA